MELKVDSIKLLQMSGKPDLVFLGCSFSVEDESPLLNLEVAPSCGMDYIRKNFPDIPVTRCLRK